MFLGVDVGTSAVKVLLVDGGEQVQAEAAVPLAVSRPHPLHSEQDPEDWWRATEAAIAQVRRQAPAELLATRAIGLSGQMHGATLLGGDQRVLRPAILWNDGRSTAECRELLKREPRMPEITGNLAFPGFTAPKLLWVQRHEPEIAARIRRVLLPKDYLRLRMTGEAVTDQADAAGTLWLDVGRRRWSPEMLAATGLDESAMPRLIEGNQISGELRPAVARAWGLGPGVLVAGGAGDNAAGAIGAGVVRPGEAMLSLGTSGVYLLAGDHFAPNPGSASHAFCHALPGRWVQTAVLLSAASCLSWVAGATGGGAEGDLVAAAAATDRDPHLLFLPYLSGERTPWNDPELRGAFVGLSHLTTREDLVRSVLEGVAFAFADGQDALLASGGSVDSVLVSGGGARSLFWGRILASALGRELLYPKGAEMGPSLGAARLARLAATGEDPEAVCRAPEIEACVAPDPELVERYASRRRLQREALDGLRAPFHALTNI
ncbi:MAG: xylulokinase [bacterium]